MADITINGVTYQVSQATLEAVLALLKQLGAIKPQVGPSEHKGDNHA